MIELHFHSLEQTLIHAIKSCQNSSGEEEGGVILSQAGVFTFTKITNDCAGTDLARGLWLANKAEFARKVLPWMTQGWKRASFHTHPGFSACPSSLDLARLFTGYPTNYIWGRRCGHLLQYDYRDGRWNDSEPGGTELQSLVASFKEVSILEVRELEAAVDKALETGTLEQVEGALTAVLQGEPSRAIEYYKE